MCKCSRKQSTLKDIFIYIILRRRGRKCCGQIKTKIKFFAINSTYCVWKKTNTAYDKKNSIPTVKHGIVYIGGCFSAKVIRRLLRIKGLVEDNLLPLNYSKFTAHYKMRSVMLGALAPAHMSWSKWVFFPLVLQCLPILGGAQSPDLPCSPVRHCRQSAGSVFKISISTSYLPVHQHPYGCLQVT